MMAFAGGKLGQIPFAESRHAASASPSSETPLKQDLQKINVRDVGPLHAMVGGLRDTADSFVTFVRSERAAGRGMGLETLASEIAFVSCDEHMGRLHSALGRALGKGEAASLSEQGFSKVRRLEALLGDALGALNHHLGDAAPVLGQAAAPAPTPTPVPAAVAAAAPTSYPASSLIIPLFIIGAIGIGTVGICAWLISKR